MCKCLRNTTLRDCECLSMAEYLSTCHRRAGKALYENWRSIQGCECKCEAPKICKECASGCPVTCSNIMQYSNKQDREKSCTRSCISGCFCPDDMVLDGLECVRQEKCPCVCKGNGAKHITKFDKRFYTFEGNCTYILSRSKPHTYPKYEIFGNISYCVSQPPTKCLNSIILRLNSTEEIILMKNLKVSVNGFVTNAPVNITSDIQVTVKSQETLELVIKSVQIIITYKHMENGFTIKVPITRYHNKTEGLCGNCNVQPTTNNTYGFWNNWKINNSSCVTPPPPPTSGPCKNETQKPCDNIKNLFKG
ncbi:mucin-6-like [Ciona intestinalis]